MTDTTETVQEAFDRRAAEHRRLVDTPLPDGWLEICMDAGFPGLPADMTVEEVHRRIRAIVNAVLPLHEQQVRARLLAEQEQERQDAHVRAEQEFLDAWNAAPRDGALRILPDGALTWRRRTPEERRAYLTDHRDEALAYGIPADLVDLMIGDAEESGHA
jgi:hypothetical protein